MVEFGGIRLELTLEKFLKKGLNFRKNKPIMLVYGLERRFLCVCPSWMEGLPGNRFHPDCGLVEISQMRHTALSRLARLVGTCGAATPTDRTKGFVRVF